MLALGLASCCLSYDGTASASFRALLPASGQGWAGEARAALLLADFSESRQGVGSQAMLDTPDHSTSPAARGQTPFWQGRCRGGGSIQPSRHFHEWRGTLLLSLASRGWGGGEWEELPGQ